MKDDHIRRLLDQIGVLRRPCDLDLLMFFIRHPRPLLSSDTPLVIVETSVLLGVIIGVTEEMLWRGVYVTLFPDRLWLNTVYPSIAFGLWHLCPLSVLSSRYPGGTRSFAAYSIALGLSYAYYARSTGSIRWCTVSHCVHDALGLGAFAYSQWLM